MKLFSVLLFFVTLHWFLVCYLANFGTDHRYWLCKLNSFCSSARILMPFLSCVTCISCHFVCFSQFEPLHILILCPCCIYSLSLGADFDASLIFIKNSPKEGLLSHTIHLSINLISSPQLRKDVQLILVHIDYFCGNHPYGYLIL